MSIQRIYYQTEVVIQKCLPVGITSEDLWEYMTEEDFNRMPKIHSDANNYEKFRPKGFDADIPADIKPTVPLEENMKWRNFWVKDFNYLEDRERLEEVLGRKVFCDDAGTLYVK
jgi:hypothetical protein